MTRAAREGRATDGERGFACPRTDAPCTDPRCLRGRCADEATRPLDPKAADRVARERQREFLRGILAGKTS